MKPERKRILYLVGLTTLAVSLIGAVWWQWPTTFHSFALRTSLVTPTEKDQVEKIGQLGDSFGGFNALMGAVTLLGLGVTIALQVHALNQREAEKELDRFDKIFARIMTSLENHLEVMTDVTKVATPRALANTTVRGKETFKIWSSQITHDEIGFRAVTKLIMDGGEPAPRLTLEHLKQAYANLFEEKHEELAPYWRLLYHAFKAIDQAEIDDDEKQLYADIVRADLTPSQSFLLALNGVGKYGPKFWKLINTYHLLKHVPGEYREILKTAYEESAFTDEDSPTA